MTRLGVTICLFLVASLFKTSAFTRKLFSSRASFQMSAAIGESVPEGIKVDIITQTDGTVCSTNEAQDFGSILKSTKKAVVFAVPVSNYIKCFSMIISIISFIDFTYRVHSLQLVLRNISLVSYQMPPHSKLKASKTSTAYRLTIASSCDHGPRIPQDVSQVALKWLLMVTANILKH